MSIEALKEQAREYEQNEQWEKALDLYTQAIDQISSDDEPDVGLFNRSGDLATRIGRDAQAVTFYEKAVDFYMAAGLPNNAIAICKKVMRNLPNRYSIYLKMGQIRAAQGFVTGARSSFVTYAERVQASGDLDEAFRALIEFVDLAPDDYEIRVMLASQLEQNGRHDEAVQQFIGAYHSMMRQGLNDQARNIEARIRALDPHASLDVDPTLAAPRVGGGDGMYSGSGHEGEAVADSAADAPPSELEDEEPQSGLGISRCCFTTTMKLRMPQPPSARPKTVLRRLPRSRLLPRPQRRKLRQRLPPPRPPRRKLRRKPPRR